jgi:hypothetical protein
LTGTGREAVKLAYLELFDGNARLAGAITCPNIASTDGHEGTRRDEIPKSFKDA